MTFPDFSYETTQQGAIVCGIDEAGRGPWAGPVVAAAVIWPDRNACAEGLNDSKKLTAIKREALYPMIMDAAIVGVGEASVHEIDELNILGATKLAMQRAYAALGQSADVALIDGNRPPVLPCRTLAIVKGDGKSLSIAAASVIAKVTRDRMMCEAALTYPQYGFERHAGYGTPAHQKALAQHGVTPLHRRSFAPIRALLEAEAA